MSKLSGYLRRGSSWCWLAALGGGAHPPGPADCEQRIAHSYDLLEQAQRQGQGKVMVVKFIAETVVAAPGQKKPQKNVAHFVLMSRHEHTYLSNGETEIYRDDQVQVSIIRPQRTILITNTGKQPAPDVLPWLKLRDQLLTQAHVTQCETVGNGPRAQRRIVAVPDPKGTLRGQVTSVEYRLDERTDALQKMTMYYPAGHGLVSSALVVGTQEVKSLDPAVDTPALSHVLGPNRQLLPAYRTFQLQDHRLK